MPDQVNQPVPASRKRVTLALAGSSGRAIAYIGMLEVFQEQGILVDAIAANSSASIIAAAYASGKLQELKERYLQLDKRQLFSLLEPSFKGGVFSLDPARNELQKYISAENIEDLHLPIAIVATDLVEERQVIFTMGSVLRAVLASCAVPGLFEPVLWGNKVLLDGGLFAQVPTEAARQFGNDIVIAADMSGTYRVMDPFMVKIKVALDLIILPFRQLNTYFKTVFYFLFSNDRKEGFSQPAYQQIRNLSIASVLNTALEFVKQGERSPQAIDCDLLLTMNITDFGRFDNSNFKAIYQQGREVAIKELPRIKALLAGQPVPDARRDLKVAEEPEHSHSWLHLPSFFHHPKPQPVKVRANSHDNRRNPHR